MQYGLLGRHLAHSYSPQIHEHLGSLPYDLFEMEPEQVGEFVRSGNVAGLNVTIPYKKAVIPYCDELTEQAKSLGAVNTIVRKDNGHLVGHNTDYFGFLQTVKKSGLHLSGKKVLVLGSGGASTTAVAVLKELGANVVVISRSGENNYNNLHHHYDASLIVNATPVGMYPVVDATALEISPFQQLEGVIDLIYNPARTVLLQAAEKRMLVSQNGLWMLVAQAKESAEWFLGKKISDHAIRQIHSHLRMQMENIILIGMPGCGKSTVGALLATKLGKEFVDADVEIQKAANKPIPEIFASSGETGFRKLETAVLADLGKRSGLVIATGGGCVTRSENYSHLHQNGTIVWLQRDIHALPTDGRPLSKSGQLVDMYEVRKPLYEQFSDITVDNDRSVETTAESIIEALKKEYDHENTCD